MTATRKAVVADTNLTRIAKDMNEVAITNSIVTNLET